MRILLLLTFSCYLLAQESRFSFGATGGFSFTARGNAVGSTNRENRPYAVGPIFQYRFTDHVSLVVNPLYRRLGSSYLLQRFPTLGSESVVSDFASRTRTHNLSVPILLKYSFGSPQRKWRPFATTGYEFGQSWNRFESKSVLTNTVTGTQQVFAGTNTDRSRLNTGVVFGGGIETKWNRFHFVPEFRYAFQNPTNSVVEGRHKADLLLSIRF